MDQVEICIGNIPVDIDLISFYHFIDKLAEGECSQIRFNISYGSMHLAVATISAKTASETARRINGKQILGVSKLDKRNRKATSQFELIAGAMMIVRKRCRGCIDAS